MIRKRLVTLVLGAALSALAVSTAFAGKWGTTANGEWYYDFYGRGVPEGYLKGWQWVDDNSDGISQCYFFDDNGIMQHSTQIEGYDLNDSGQWVINGVVQHRGAGMTAAGSGQPVDLIDTAAPTEMNFAETFETAQAASGQEFNSGICLSGSISHASYVVYDLSGIQNPSVMTLTYAPKAGIGKATDARISVTGLTTGKNLYHSPKFGPTAPASSINFSVVNEKAVRISVIRGFDILLDSVLVQ